VNAVDPRRSLELLSPEVKALNRDIAGLTPEQWTSDCNCAGWQVADLAAHVVRNGWSMLTFVQRALAGDQTPAFGPAAAELQEEIKAAGPQAGAERQARETAEFIGLVSGLPEADMAKLGVHPAGARSITWASTQRLAEASFHHWDLRRSLGIDGPLSSELAAQLLPFMLDPQGSNIMTKAAQDVASDTYRLRATDSGASWRITAGPQGRQVEAQADGPASLEVSAGGGWLALALYGRVPLEGPNFDLEGPPEAVSRFRACFGC
jgi:uncharacterized protein (TIGR03083 family)